MKILVTGGTGYIGSHTVVELQNYTHVDGIFTANPELVPEAKIIRHLSYEEANELA